MEAAADGFLTGANDGKVIAYNCGGDVQFTCETVANVVAGGRGEA